MPIEVTVTSVVENCGPLIEFTGTATIDGGPAQVNFFTDVVEAARIAWQLDQDEKAVVSVPTFMLGTIESSTAAVA